MLDIAKQTRNYIYIYIYKDIEISCLHDHKTCRSAAVIFHGCFFVQIVVPAMNGFCFKTMSVPRPDYSSNNPTQDHTPPGWKTVQFICHKSLWKEYDISLLCGHIDFICLSCWRQILLLRERKIKPMSPHHNLHILCIVVGKSVA